MHQKSECLVYRRRFPAHMGKCPSILSRNIKFKTNIKKYISISSINSNKTINQSHHPIKGQIWLETKPMPQRNSNNCSTSKIICSTFRRRKTRISNSTISLKWQMHINSMHSRFRKCMFLSWKSNKCS